MRQASRIRGSILICRDERSGLDAGIRVSVQARSMSVGRSRRPLSYLSWPGATVPGCWTSP